MDLVALDRAAQTESIALLYRHVGKIIEAA